MDPARGTAGAVTVSDTRGHRVLSAIALLATVTACGATTPPTGPTTSSSTAQLSTPPAATVPSVAAPRMQKWVDLVVGDCVAAVPRVELGEVEVTMADCATPHQAEVYLLAPIEVNAAITDVANQQCAAGLGPYAGATTSEFAVTYLIDSRQDRTDNNPLPSTVICLLQRNDGQPITGSARQ